MSVKINVDGRFLENRSNKDLIVEVSGNTVGECLNNLVKQQPTIKKTVFDEEGNLRYLIILVNRKFIFPEKLAKVVKDGDEISLVNLTGGCCT